MTDERVPEVTAEIIAQVGVSGPAEPEPEQEGDGDDDE